MIHTSQPKRSRATSETPSRLQPLSTEALPSEALSSEPLPCEPLLSEPLPGIGLPDLDGHPITNDDPFDSSSLNDQLGSDQPVCDQHGSDQFDFELAKRILQRIELRLPGRIRHLTVFTTENAVILAGDCCTFYSKQLAQHTAMGVLEYERLINNIEVRVPK